MNIVEHKITPNRADRFQIDSRLLLAPPPLFTSPASINTIIYSQINDILYKIEEKTENSSNAAIEALNFLVDSYQLLSVEPIISKFLIPRLVEFSAQNSYICSQGILSFLEKFLLLGDENSSHFFQPIIVNSLFAYISDILKLNIKNHSAEKTITGVIFSLLHLHHNSNFIFQSTPIITVLGCMFSNYLPTLNTTIHRWFNIFDIDGSYADLFYASYNIIQCFSIMIEVSTECSNDVHVVTDYLVESSFSRCIQISNEAMSALLVCSQKYPELFYRCLKRFEAENDNKSEDHRKEPLISMIDPDNNDPITNLLVLDILAKYIQNFDENETYNFIIKYNNIHFSIFSHLLRVDFLRYCLPVSLIILHLIKTFKSACNCIYNSNSNVIRTLFELYSSQLPVKPKTAILHLYIFCVVYGTSSIVMDLGNRNEEFLNDVFDIADLIIPKDFQYLIQFLIRLLDLSKLDIRFIGLRFAILKSFSGGLIYKIEELSIEYGIEKDLFDVLKESIDSEDKINDN